MAAHVSTSSMTTLMGRLATALSLQPVMLTTLVRTMTRTTRLVALNIQ